MDLRFCLRVCYFVVALRLFSFVRFIFFIPRHGWILSNWEPGAIQYRDSDDGAGPPIGTGSERVLYGPRSMVTGQRVDGCRGIGGGHKLDFCGLLDGLHHGIA